MSRKVIEFKGKYAQFNDFGKLSSKKMATVLKHLNSEVPNEELPSSDDSDDGKNEKPGPASAAERPPVRETFTMPGGEIVELPPDDEHNASASAPSKFAGSPSAQEPESVKAQSNESGPDAVSTESVHSVVASQAPTPAPVQEQHAVVPGDLRKMVDAPLANISDHPEVPFHRHDPPRVPEMPEIDEAFPKTPTLNPVLDAIQITSDTDVPPKAAAPAAAMTSPPIQTEAAASSSGKRKRKKKKKKKKRNIGNEVPLKISKNSSTTSTSLLPSASSSSNVTVSLSENTRIIQRQPSTSSIHISHRITILNFYSAKPTSYDIIQNNQTKYGYTYDKERAKPEVNSMNVAINRYSITFSIFSNEELENIKKYNKTEKETNWINNFNIDQLRNANPFIVPHPLDQDDVIRCMLLATKASIDSEKGKAKEEMDLQEAIKSETKLKEAARCAETVKKIEEVLNKKGKGFLKFAVKKYE